MMRIIKIDFILNRLNRIGSLGKLIKDEELYQEEPEDFNANLAIKTFT